MSGQGGGEAKERVTQRFTVTLAEGKRMEVAFRVWEDVALPGDVLPDFRTERKPSWHEMEMATSQLRRFLSAQVEASLVEVKPEGGRG